MVESTHGRLGFTAPLAGITAAVVGVIINLAVFFGSRVIWPGGWASGGLHGIDFVAAGLALVAALALFRFRVGVIPVILASAIAGWSLSIAGVR